MYSRNQRLLSYMPIPLTIEQLREIPKVDPPLIARIGAGIPGSSLQEQSNVPLEEAIQIVRTIAHKTGTETISVDEADGRILSETIHAPTDLPGFDRSTMSGYAIIASDIADASESNPCYLTLIGIVHRGVSESERIHHGQAIAIQTGGKLPEGGDVVVNSEVCTVEGDQVRITHPLAPYSNVLQKDEDFKKNEAVYPAGWEVRPQDIGVLASIGKVRVKVLKKPVIGIISTGRELVPSESIPKSGEVREVNSYLISAFCKRQGAIPVRYGIVRDDAEVLTSLLREASLECDAIIVSGGSARDQHDITAQVIHTLGKVYTEGISFAPDKRTTIGKIGTVLVIGLPGHPSATFMVLTLVVIHLIQAMKGSPSQRIYRKQVVLTDHLCAGRDSDRYIRVSITDEYASPVFGKAGLIHMLSQSDGIVRVPAGSEGYREGDRVEVMTW
ncbi:MAG TPA: gephyrin-like molybdotransferase Glp [Methanospirillum sp.]|nr:gephyrin-like molybdotransferase Glp [Methanospirillum sp.]